MWRPAGPRLSAGIALFPKSLGGATGQIIWLGPFYLMGRGQGRGKDSRTKLRKPSGINLYTWSAVVESHPSCRCSRLARTGLGGAAGLTRTGSPPAHTHGGVTVTTLQGLGQDVSIVQCLRGENAIFTRPAQVV
jgi:hypothetical protein